MNEYEVSRIVLKLANRIISNRNRHSIKLGITTEQADSLRFFQDNPGSSIKDLQLYLGVRHQTAQGIASRMLEKGFITLSVSGQDKRCKIVVVTEKGVDMLNELRKNGIHTGQRLLHGMSMDEQAEFARLILKAYENVDEEENNERD